MKKSLLLILASLFAVFALTGCAEDSKNDTPAQTPVDPELVQQIKQFTEGYYEITFFHTDGAGLLPMTNDCTEAVNQGLMEDTCTDTPTKGYGQITVDDNGNMKLITKIQMDLSSLSPILYSAGKNSQYNYTEYPLLPASSVDMTDITTGTITINANKAVKGTTGRDLATNTSDDAAEYSFTFNVSNKTITNKMITTTPESVTDLGLGSPTTNVTVVMRKLNGDLPSGYTMDKDVRFPEPTNVDIEASLGGGNEENPGGEGEDNPSEEPTPSPYMNLIGEYNVDSLTLGDSTQQNAGTANLNTQDTSLILGLNLSDGALKVFVYSEDPATLMASGFTPSVDEQGNTVVDFTLGSLATIKMTRNTPYNTVNTGIGSAQEAISLNINNGSNISAETTEFNVVVNHTSAENKYYNISFYDNSAQDLGLPVGTYVGVVTGPNKDFNATRVNTENTSTTYSVDISSLTKTDNAEYVVVVEETDAEGSVSGAVTVGLLKLVVSSVQ